MNKAQLFGNENPDAFIQTNNGGGGVSKREEMIAMKRNMRGGNNSVQFDLHGNTKPPPAARAKKTTQFANVEKI